MAVPDLVRSDTTGFVFKGELKFFNLTFESGIFYMHPSAGERTEDYNIKKSGNKREQIQTEDKFK